MTNKARLEDILCDFYNFYDYEIHCASKFGKNDAMGINRLVDTENMWYDIDDSIETFVRDGYGTIHFYINENTNNNVINLSEYKAKRGL